MFTYKAVKALIKEEDKILLIQTDKTKRVTPHHTDYWDLPGGLIDNEENETSALKREVFEEIGISNIIISKSIGSFRSNTQKPHGKTLVYTMITIYLCSVDGTFEIQLSDEHQSYRWFSIKEAGELLSYKYPDEFTKGLLLGEI